MIKPRGYRETKIDRRISVNQGNHRQLNSYREIWSALLLLVLNWKRRFVSFIRVESSRGTGLPEAAVV